jgi:uncharacterized protein YndB with AHSA1/START domain
MPMHPATERKLTEAGLPSLTFVRSFDAPRELMFSLWTDPKHIARWWAPHDFTVPLAEFDARAGGKVRIDFRTRDGFVFANFGEVKESSPPDRLVFTIEYREGATLMVASSVTVDFKEPVPGKTRLTIHSEVTFALPEAANLTGMEEGWTQQLEKLDLHAIVAANGADSRLTVFAPANRPVILMTRMFDAPRELVWKCLTEKQRFVRWWGPRGSSNEITDFDVRVGGKWRVISRDEQGSEFIFFGFYREIVEPERMVNTFAMENMFEGKEIVETLTLEDFGGRTRYSTLSRFAEIADRDGMLASGMEGGATESMERLAEELQHLSQEQAR